MNNKKIGNTFEQDFCDLLFNNGFWAHNMAQNQSGQPADVIAVKNRKAYLIDCKVCSNNKFPFSRIESNQHMAMALWKQSGNGEGWFALQSKDGQVYMFTYGMLDKLSSESEGLSEKDIIYYGLTIERWIELCG